MREPHTCPPTTWWQSRVSSIGFFVGNCRVWGSRPKDHMHSYGFGSLDTLMVGCRDAYTQLHSCFAAGSFCQDALHVIPYKYWQARSVMACLSGWPMHTQPADGASWPSASLNCSIFFWLRHGLLPLYFSHQFAHTPYESIWLQRPVPRIMWIHMVSGHNHYSGWV